MVWEPQTMSSRAEQEARAAADLADHLVRLGHHTAAQQAARRELELVGDRRGGIRTRALTALGVSRAYVDAPVVGLATLDDALAGADTAADALLVRQRLAELLTGPLNDLDRGVEVARAGADVAVRSGLGRTHGARLSAVAAAGLFRAGRWAEATLVVGAALERAPAGDDAADLRLAGAAVALARGDLDRSGRDLDLAEASTGGVRHVLPLSTLRAALLLRLGRPGEAVETVHRGLSRWAASEWEAEDLEPRAELVWHGLRAAAGSRRRQDDADGRVAGLLAAVREFATGSRAAAAPVREAVDGYLASCDAELSRLTGRHEVRRWDRVSAFWQRRRHPYPEAYARLRSGSTCRTSSTSSGSPTGSRPAPSTGRRIRGRDPYVVVRSRDSGYDRAVDGDGDDEETLLDEPVTVANLAELRGHVLGLARRAGLPEERAQDFVLAVYEAVTNAVKHAGGGGQLAVVRDDQRRLIADVHDAGPGMPYSVTITLPPPTAAGGRGLWLASNLVDHVDVRSAPEGTTVRLEMSLEAD
jgi:anti-sigma regulatory factor (Ser/Thr protein kinase)